MKIKYVPNEEEYGFAMTRVTHPFVPYKTNFQNKKNIKK